MAKCITYGQTDWMSDRSSHRLSPTVPSINPLTHLLSDWLPGRQTNLLTWAGPTNYERLHAIEWRSERLSCFFLLRNCIFFRQYILEDFYFFFVGFNVLGRFIFRWGGRGVLQWWSSRLRKTVFCPQIRSTPVRQEFLLSFLISLRFFKCQCLEFGGRSKQNLHVYDDFLYSPNLST